MLIYVATIMATGKVIFYRIASNLTDISNYPDTILNYFLPLISYTGQSMKFEFNNLDVVGQLTLAWY